MQKIQIIAGVLSLAFVFACGKTSTETMADTNPVLKDSTISPKKPAEKPAPKPKQGVIQRIASLAKKAKKEIQELTAPPTPTDTMSSNIVEEAVTAPTQEKPFEMPLVSLNIMMESLTSGPQAFSIPATEPTAIQLPQGTQVLIPENAFMIEDSEIPVKGDVLLLAKEYLSTTDILRANLSTESPEGILETGGMLYLEAQYQGKRCALQKDKRIQLMLPTKGRKKQKDMQLFEGQRDEDGKLLWNALAPFEFAVQDTLRREYTTSAQSFKEFVNSTINYVHNFKWLEVNRPVVKIKSVRVRQGGIITDMDQNVRCPRTYFSLTEFPIKYCSVEWSKGKNDSIPTFTQKQDKAATYKVRINTDLITGNLTYPLYPGDLRDIPVGMSHYIMRSIRRHRWTNGENEAEFEVYVPRRYKRVLQTKYGKDYTEGGCEENYRKEYKDYITNFKPITYYYTPPVVSAVQQMQNYIFSSTKLGWINCDRFPAYQARTNFKVNLGEATEAQAFLIFNNIRSVISTSYNETYNMNKEENVVDKQKNCDFFNMPLKEKITLLVIKTENNKQYYAMKDTQISKNTETSLEFKPLDRDILAQLTKDLGQRFD